ELHHSGAYYKTTCPFHNEKSPSFFVSPSRGTYHCFGCGVHGSAINFLMEYEHLEYVEAIESIAATLGMAVPREQDGRGRGERSGRQKPDAGLYDLLQAVADFYRAELEKSPQASAYAAQRGLDRDMLARFGIGFAPDGWDNLLNRFGRRFGQEQLQAAGMLASNEAGRVYDRFRGRLMFPIRDRRGRAIGFGGRIMGEGGPKYLNSPETELFHKGSELYGLYEARQATRQLERLLVVEGYMDVIALAQFGVTYAVATLGTATTDQHVKLLFRLVPEVVFCFDGDRAGREAAWRALENALPELRDDREIRFLFLPDGEDPDSLIRARGREAFEQALGRSMPLSRFFIQGLKESLGFEADSTLHELEDSNRFSAEATRLLKAMPDILLKRQLLDEVQRLGKVVLPGRAPIGGAVSGQVPFGTRNHANGWRSWRSGPAREENPGYIPNEAREFEIRKTPVRYAITLLLYDPGLAALVENPEKMLVWDLPGIDLLLQLVEIIEDNPHIHSAGLLERFRGTGHEKALGNLVAWQPAQADAALLQREFQDCLRQIKRKVHEKALDLLFYKEQTEGLTPQERHDLLSLLQEIHGPGE
ncbi:MAG: DNA primase, partial [Thiothrix sp.]|nr:DNA primase [Thiothrix sp.]